MAEIDKETAKKRKVSTSSVCAGPAFLRIKENLGMYGFGSLSDAHFQTIKELIENSLDALKSSPNNHLGCIKITLNEHRIESEWLQITVTDNGCGIADPSAALSCFMTTKTDGADCDETEAPKFIGKFGLGLFCLVLYSTMSTDEHIRILTKTSLSIQAVIADYKLDINKQKIIEIQKIETTPPADFKHGTCVTVALPKSDLNSTYSDRTAIQRLIEQVHKYITQLLWLPSTLKLSLHVHVGSIDYDKEYTSPTIAVEGYNSDPNIAHDEYAHRYLASNLPIPYPLANVDACTARLEGTSVKDDASVTVTALFLGPPPPGASTSTVKPPLYEYSLSDMGLTSIPLTVYRYANGVPILDRNDDALACAVSAGLRDVKWGPLFGSKLKAVEGGKRGSNKRSARKSGRQSVIVEVDDEDEESEQEEVAEARDSDDGGTLESQTSLPGKHCIYVYTVYS